MTEPPTPAERRLMRLGAANFMKRYPPNDDPNRRDVGNYADFGRAQYGRILQLLDALEKAEGEEVCDESQVCIVHWVSRADYDELVDEIGAHATDMGERDGTNAGLREKLKEAERKLATAEETRLEAIETCCINIIVTESKPRPFEDD